MLGAILFINTNDHDVWAWNENIGGELTIKSTYMSLCNEKDLGNGANYYRWI